MYELNDLLREWAQKNGRVFDDDTLDNAVHAVNKMLPSRRHSRYNRMTRRGADYVVTDGTRTYVASSFREAQHVLKQCHAEDLSVTGYIGMYCEG